MLIPMPAHSGRTSSVLENNELEDANVTVAIGFTVRHDDIDTLSIRLLATARSIVMFAVLIMIINMLPVIRRTLQPQGQLAKGHKVPLTTRRCPAQTRTFLQSTRPTKRPSLHTHPRPTRPQTRNATFSSHNPYSPRTLLRNHPIAFPLAIGS